LRYQKNIIITSAKKTNVGTRSGETTFSISDGANYVGISGVVGIHVKIHLIIPMWSTLLPAFKKINIL